MTATDQFDWLDSAADSPRERQSEAAADLALEACVILENAFSARPDISQVALAALLEVSESRVSQVLNGDGNVHIATLARYMRALGYELEIQAKPVEAAAPPILRESRHDARVHVYRTRYLSTAGVYEGLHTIQTESDEVPIPLEVAQPVNTRKLASPKRSYVSDRRVKPSTPRSKSPEIMPEGARAEKVASLGLR